MPNVAISRMMSGWLTSGPQHQPLDRDREPVHDGDREDQRDPGGDALFMQADQRQRREHHHDALGEIEHARGLVDEHEAERDQRIEDAADEALPDRLRQKIGRGDHLGERVDEDGVQEVHGLTPHAEIGVDDLLIRLDGVGDAVGDLAAVIEHHDPVGEVHDDADVVLDEGDGRAAGRLASTMKRLMSSFSSRFMPAIGSSSSKSCGSIASARPSSTRFCKP